MDATTLSASLRDQEDLVNQLEAEGWDLMIGSAFVRGMRDIGYKSTAFAMAELIDNSIQAGAAKVDVLFGFQNGAKPSQIAIIDDGHGMTPQMTRASLIWGAGTRSNRRDGFGKYGYGLPTASISQCFRVEVYSKVAGGSWYRGYLDVDEIKEGAWTTGNRIQTPVEELAEPPAFVVKHLKSDKRWGEFSHGTIVVWDRLDKDRIDYKRREELRNKLVTDLGVIYRNYLLDTPLTVDGVTVAPCDPLFIREGFRFHDLDEDRAIELPGAVIDVKDKDTNDVIGHMRVRFARMPATFFRKPNYKRTNKPGKNTNERLEIADANNGILFLRQGRQIDVVRPPRKLASFNATTDRFWGVEVDFDPSLDELFSITTSKQQVTPSDRVWDILADKAKVFDAIGQMRTEYGKEAAVIRAELENQKQEAQRASIEAIEAAEKFRTTKKPDETPERNKEAKDNLDRQARKRAEQAGIKPEVVERELIAERQGVGYLVETEEIPGGAFFRCVQEGGTRVLYLNTEHRFYTDLYASPSSTPRLRAGLEVLLWTLGNAEVDADPESPRRQFYERERSSVWTPQLADALAMLKTISVVETEVETDAEQEAA